MESQPFDNIARGLATGTSRRTLLRGLAGGVLAAAGRVAPVLAHEAHGDGSINTLEHCGTCGNACTDAPAKGSPACLDGTCGFTCDEGYHEEEGACVPLMSPVLRVVRGCNCHWGMKGQGFAPNTYYHFDFYFGGDPKGGPNLKSDKHGKYDLDDVAISPGDVSFQIKAFKTDHSGTAIAVSDVGTCYSDSQ